MEVQFLTIESTRRELEKSEADYRRMKKVYENKKHLYDMEGISLEELEASEMEFLEKKLGLSQNRSKLAVKMIGYRDEDLIQAGYELPEDDKEKKLLLLEYNTRMLQAEVDAARAGLEASLCQLETLELYLSETCISAPISGIIGRKYMEAGEKASPEKPLYMIFPEDKVYALAEISEKDLSPLFPGQTVLVSSDFCPESRQGTLERISPWLSQDSRTATVKILLDNRDSLFRIGQFVRIRVELSEAEPTVMIPREALLYEDGSPYVFTLRGSRLFRTELDCGEDRGRLVPVFQGLSTGDRIILDPRKSFREGMEVSLK